MQRREGCVCEITRRKGTWRAASAMLGLVTGMGDWPHHHMLWPTSSSWQRRMRKIPGMLLCAVSAQSALCTIAVFGPRRKNKSPRGQPARVAARPNTRSVQAGTAGQVAYHPAARRGPCSTASTRCVASIRQSRWEGAQMLVMRHAGMQRNKAPCILATMLEDTGALPRKSGEASQPSHIAKA